MTTVPDFFQDDSEEALRCQVEWQNHHLGLGTPFFARLLREDPRRFSSWGKDEDTLPREKEERLRDWWRTVLHLLSFLNFDEEKVRGLLERKVATAPATELSVFSPPWSASSLREYLEEHGTDAIPEVNRWVESFRFGDPDAPLPKGSPCLSTRP